MNGSYFQGNFDNNMPKGTGEWHFGSNCVQGSYKQTNTVETEGIKLSWQTTGMQAH